MIPQNYALLIMLYQEGGVQELYLALVIGWMPDGEDTFKPVVIVPDGEAIAWDGQWKPWKQTLV